MTIRKLKEIIKNLPDDMRVYADNGSKGMFTDNTEFVCAPYYKDMLVLQTSEDFDVAEELRARCEYASENEIDEQDFWDDIDECGYKPEDFPSDMLEWATVNYNHYVNGIN